MQIPGWNNILSIIIAIAMISSCSLIAYLFQKYLFSKYKNKAKNEANK